MIVVFAVIFFDRIKIDDPVGAVSVHGVCGAWGLISVGLFAKYDDAFLGRRRCRAVLRRWRRPTRDAGVMVVIIAAWTIATASILFFVLTKTIGLRVSAEEEMEGLDVLEHGLAGYPDDVSYV